MNVVQFTLQVARPYKKYIVGMLAAMGGISCYTNFQGYLIKLLIDAVAEPSQQGVVLLACSYAVLQIINVFVWAWYDRSVFKMNEMRNEISTLMLNRIAQYDITFFQSNFSGSIATNVRDAANLIPLMIFTAVDNYFYLLIVVIVASVLLAKIHIMFFVAMICWVCLYLVIMYRNLVTINDLSVRTAEVDATLWGRVVDYVSNMVVVKYFAANRYEMAHLATVQEEYSKAAWAKGYFLIKFYVWLGLLFSAYIVGCLFFLIYLRGQNLITPGDFAFVFAINYKIVDQLFTITHTMRDFISYWGTVDQALQVLNLPVEIPDKQDAVQLQVSKAAITFDAVQFHYKGAEPLFENKSVLIPAGQKVGLVGFSGGGKSTFVNLILRLYDVSSGAILIDGQNIRDVTQNSLRRAIGMIPQDASLFNRTLMENIRYGRLDATDAEVIEAAKKAHVHEFISKLPDGYYTVVGERGAKISGGQRQRIAIARAMLKNAPILILDEATSQLDSITEQLIQESLWTLMQDKTTLVVAHRLSTLLHMDRILVFEHGKIVQDGTHQELLARGGLYKTLWNAQVGGFLLDEGTELQQDTID